MQERHRDLRAEISDMLEEGVTPADIEAFLDGLKPAGVLHTIFPRDSDSQRALLAALTPHGAASLVEGLQDAVYSSSTVTP